MFTKRFTFWFFENDGSYNSYYIINLNFKNEEQSEKLDDLVYDFSYEMEEKFGTHDIGILDGDFLGYESFEIPKSKELTVMKKWRNFFIKNGVDCDPVKHVTEKEFNHV